MKDSKGYIVLQENITTKNYILQFNNFNKICVSHIFPIVLLSLWDLHEICVYMDY